MSIQELEQAISRLSQKDLSDFRLWFSEFDAETWDQQFQEDVEAGRLNALADEALRDLKQGRTSDL
jgi:hypothetical protein